VFKCNSVYTIQYEASQQKLFIHAEKGLFGVVGILIKEDEV